MMQRYDLTKPSLHPRFKSFTFQDSSQSQHPINGINWAQADQYCRLLCPTCRLPSYLEWLYAADFEYEKRMIEENKRSSAHYCINKSRLNKVSLSKTCPVGSHLENRFELYDMFGNVAEWVDHTIDLPILIQARFIRKEQMAYKRKLRRFGKNRVVVESYLRQIAKVQTRYFFGGDWYDSINEMLKPGSRRIGFASDRIGFRCVGKNL